MSTTRDRNRVAFFARTNFRGESGMFGIRQADRRAHMYIIGKTGTGKSTLLAQLIDHDVRSGQGFALIDPHGDLVERVHARIPASRASDLVYLDTSQVGRRLAFNPLDARSISHRGLIASGLIDTFRHIWAESWGPRMEHVLRNALLTLLDQPEPTLAGVLRLLDDHVFRRSAVERVTNPQVREFWVKEFGQYPDRFRAEVIAPIQNKVGAFLADPVLQEILIQPRSSFDLKEVMDEGKILLVNLAKGRIGTDTSALLGALLVSSIGLTGLGRAAMAEHDRRDFHLYLDEFHTFTTLSLASMLSELRKYRVNLVLAHQYLGQLELPIRDAILGNVGTMVSFRLGLADAKILEDEFAPVFSREDLMGLPNYHIYLKLMIDSVVSRPFSAETLAPR